MQKILSWKSTTSVVQAQQLRNKKTVPALVALMLAGLLVACGTALPDTAPDEVQPEVLDDIAALDWYGAAIGYGEGEATLESTSADGTMVVVGSGSDIWSTRDEFYYAYTTLEGDAVMSVRLDDFSASDPWAKAGVMIRESLDPTALNALIHISAGNGSVFQARLAEGDSTVNHAGSDREATAGGWLRLSRVGDLFTGELSADGETWTGVGSYEIAMDKQVLIGLAVTSHDRGAEATAKFSDLSYRHNGSVQPAPDPSRPSEPTPPSESSPPSQPGSPFVLPPATLYVATNGNDSNSGRSVDTPLRTLTRAASLVVPGDVVYIRGGIYSIDVNFRESGTATKPIVWSSYPGEWAILDGSDRPKLSSGMMTVSSSYNAFANFEIRYGPTKGILVFGSDNLFTGLVSHGHNHVGVQNYGGNRNRYEFLTIYDNFDEVNARGEPGQDADGIQIFSGDRNVISRVLSYGNSDDGFDTWMSTNTIIEFSVSHSNGRGSHGNGNGFKAGGPADNYTIVRNSIAYNNLARGFSDNGGRHVTFVNNTAFNNNWVAFQGGSTSTFTNNLSIGGSLDVNSAHQDHNSWNLGITNALVLSTDPLHPDFLGLAGNSPAIDAGIDAGYAYSGSAPDLGALEYGVTFATLSDDVRSAN